MNEEEYRAEPVDEGTVCLPDDIETAPAEVGVAGCTSDSTELVAAESADDESTLSIEGNVVEKIVAITCRSVDGILQMKGNLFSSIQEGFGGTDVTKGVQVEMVGEDACTVSVAIIMEYGKSAPKIFKELHDKITEKITDMTGLKVNAVNVRIVNVMTREEIEGRRRRERQQAEAEKGSQPQGAPGAGAQGAGPQGAQV